MDQHSSEYDMTSIMGDFAEEVSSARSPALPLKLSLLDGYGSGF